MRELLTSDTPESDYGDLRSWFDGALEALAPDAPEYTEAWEAFQRAYERRHREIIDSILDILRSTEKVVLYRHELMEITIGGRTCRLEGPEALVGRKFQAWYFFTHGLRVSLPPKDWAELVDGWLDMAEQGAFEEAAMGGALAVESILNYLRSQPLTTTKEEMEDSPFLPYLKSQEEVLLSGGVIQEQVESDGISMKMLSSLMKRYLAGPTAQLRIGPRRIRYWRFDPVKVGIEIQRTLVTEDGAGK